MKNQESRGVDSTARNEIDSREVVAADSARTRPRLAIVVPCFNEEPVIRETVRRLVAVLRDLREKGLVEVGSFLYFVDDGSKDRTWSIIR
jgi:cellulose synthase/poly-beta-1,6-N-acetylglucosamine synthase-like glycosyltransferase